MPWVLGGGGDIGDSGTGNPTLTGNCTITSFLQVTDYLQINPGTVQQLRMTHIILERVQGSGAISFGCGVDTIERITMLNFAGLSIAQTAQSVGASALIITPGAHTALTAEVIDFSLAAHTMTITGGFTTERFTVFGIPTISAASALTVTNAATVAIAGPPAVAASAVITNPISLWIQGGILRADGIGIKVGSSAAHATTAGTNIISLYTGTAPVGTLASGGSLYVATATNVELNYIDSGGNAQQLSTT